MLHSGKLYYFSKSNRVIQVLKDLEDELDQQDPKLVIEFFTMSMFAYLLMFNSICCSISGSLELVSRLLNTTQVG